MLPVGIWDTLCCTVAKIILMVGDKAKTACSDPQLCSGLDAGINDDTHVIIHRRGGEYNQTVSIGS